MEQDDDRPFADIRGDVQDRPLRRAETVQQRRPLQERPSLRRILHPLCEPPHDGDYCSMVSADAQEAANVGWPIVRGLGTVKT